MKIKKRKRVKQATALALSAVMAMSGLPYLGTNSAYAWTPATTLSSENSEIGSGDDFAHGVGTNAYYNSSESTAFTVGAGTGGTNDNYQYQNGTQFNISAVLTDNSRGDAQSGYNTTVKTAYGSNWWVTRYAFGTAAQVRPDITWAPDGVTPTAATSPTTALNVLAGASSGATYQNGQAVEAVNPANTAEKVEVRVALKKAEDDDNVIVEYTVYNPNTHPVDFWLGSETDTMMHLSDDTPLLQTAQPSSTTAPANKARGFAMFASHGTNSEGSGASSNPYALSDFTLLTQSPDSSLNVGMQKRDAADPSQVQSWVGKWSQTAGVWHEAYTMVESPSTVANVGDSAAGFSAYFNLQPGETKTARFALRMRVAVYYVDPTYDGTSEGTSNGFISRPYTNIQDAINQMQAAGVKKGYIALHHDTEINNTITIPSGMDITFISSDFERPMCQLVDIHRGLLR